MHNDNYAMDIMTLLKITVMEISFLYNIFYLIKRGNENEQIKIGSTNHLRTGCEEGNRLLT